MLLGTIKKTKTATEPEYSGKITEYFNYLKDYFTSTSQLALVVTEKIEEYLENGEGMTLEMLEKLTERNDGIYLKRVLKQTEQINTQQIYQTTENWFKTMFEHQII